MTAAPTATRAPVALTVAFVVVVGQTVAEAAVVLDRPDYGPGGKGFVLSMLALQLACAHWARRLRAGGAVGLLLFEVVGILVALGADWSVPVRLALASSVVAVFWLVLSSLHAFPTPELP